MKISKSYISLKGVKFYAFHGVMPQERKVGNTFIVSAKIGFNISKAAVSDLVDDTLNYADIYSVIKREMTTPSNLIECVAGRIAEALCNEFPAITDGEIEVEKCSPPITGDIRGASVTVVWDNNNSI